ncbi:uncharacterized protein LOC127705959 [Mytilus californianus]|uniref:uncharacterized protein LOC127705959 n=1 Tax=Mytilus californianus TaxID=6549 RepID=UPI002245662C|nr:uncharacterized protein LOC127705959 [Mytilus californianus]
MDVVTVSWLKVFLVSFFEFTIDATECLKNDDIGWRQGNIYSCNDQTKSECCEKDHKFTCCEPAKDTTLREQFQLWGVVAFFIMIIFIIYMYLKKDVEIFTRPTLKDSILSLVRANNRQSDEASTAERSNRKDSTTYTRTGIKNKPQLNEDEDSCWSDSQSESDIEPVNGMSSTENDGSLNLQSKMDVQNKNRTQI